VRFAHLRLWREAITERDCRLAQFPPVCWVEIFHEGGEVNHISLCPAAEALEDAAVKVGRERRRVSFSLVIRQRAEAQVLRALAFDLDSVVLEHLLKVEAGAERLEVNPCAHSIILR
jgi:hypothetical protein